MKRAIQTYTFAPGGAGVGTITFSDFTTIALDKILVIFNTTRGVIVFNLADPTKGGTVATNVLTLAFDTSTYSSGDKLYITYDDDDLDYDSGGGVARRHAEGIIVPGAGGPVAITGDAANGLDVDVTRVTGTVTVDTELPAAAALADATANPTTPLAGAALELYNGTTWDRVRGDTTNGIDVDVTRVTGTVTTSQTPATSGGLTIGPGSGAKLISAASPNATSVKGSAGQVYGWYITNTNASARFVKLYNKASSPTVGTDVPVMTLLIPGNTSGSGAVAAEFVSGIAFGAGIALALTTGSADADTGAVAASEIIVNLFFK